MNGVSHVAIGVRDMDKSLKFYRDLLGLEVRFDATQPIGGMPQLYASPEKGTRRAVHLHYGNGPSSGFLVLSEMPGGSPGRRSSSMKSEFRIFRGGSRIFTRGMRSSKPQA